MGDRNDSLKAFLHLKSGLRYRVYPDQLVIGFGKSIPAFRMEGNGIVARFGKGVLGARLDAAIAVAEVPLVDRIGAAFSQFENDSTAPKTNLGPHIKTVSHL